MKYRKRPVVVEAVQLRWDNWSEMCDHAGVGRLSDGKPEGCTLDPVTFAPHETPQPSPPALMGLLIPTLEGVMLAKQDDWVIRGIAGELYPCKPDIFEATYEAIPQPEDGEGMDTSEIE